MFLRWWKLWKNIEKFYRFCASMTCNANPNSVWWFNCFVANVVYRYDFSWKSFSPEKKLDDEHSILLWYVWQDFHWKWEIVHKMKVRVSSSRSKFASFSPADKNKHSTKAQCPHRLSWESPISIRFFVQTNKKSLC